MKGCVHMSYIAKTTSKGHDYYKVMESYRVDGKTKHRVLLNIGTLQNLFALLPEHVRKGSAFAAADLSATYADKNITINPVRCRCHGAPYLIWSTAKWLDIEGIMDTCFKHATDHSVSRSKTLLLGAIHRACHPGSKNEFADWFRHTSLPDYLNVNPDVFTSQHFWEQMDEITVDQIKQFETLLYKKIIAQFPDVIEKLDCLSSDFTNYYTFINAQNYRCEIAQFGHSKEGRSGQKIFSVAVVTTPLLGIPIATLMYNGNLNDKTALKLFLSELKERLTGIIDLSKITFVFDGGGTSEEVLDMIPGHYISRGSIKNATELYNIPLSSFEVFDLENDKQVKAFRTKANQFGKQRTVVISLSDELRAGQEAELNKQLCRFQEEIHDINESLGNPRATMDKRLDSIKQRISKLLLPAFHFSDFVTVSYETEQKKDPIMLRQYKKARKDFSGDKSLFVYKTEGIEIRSENDIPDVSVVTTIICQVDETKKTAMADKYYGKHLLVTDQDDWTTEKILNVYRDQEYIERFFRDSKDTSHFSVRPVFHWTDQKLRVHVMMCYLGLTLCRVAQYLLKTKQSFSISCSKLLDQLEKVQECIVIANIDGSQIKPIRSISELEPAEEQIWNAVSSLLQYMKDNPAQAT